MRLRRAAAAAAAGLVLTATAACQDPVPGAAPGHLRIGIATDQPGLSVKSGDGYLGFDIDVATYVAKRLGYSDIRFIPAPPAQRAFLLTTGQVDFVVAAYSMTDRTADRVTFAGPYLNVGQSLLVRAGSRIAGPGDLAGNTVCTLAGSTSAQVLIDRFPGVRLQVNDSYAACPRRLLAGSADAISGDDIVLAGIAAQPEYADRLRRVDTTFAAQRYGIALPKGNLDLCRRVNDALTTMVDSGAWRRAADAHFTPIGYRFSTASNPPVLRPCR